MTTTEAVATLRRMADPNSHWLSAREKEALGLAVELLEPKPEMTLEEAVKVLNEHGYDGHRDWAADGRCVFNGDSDKDLVFDDDGVAKIDMWIDDFTAIAVAREFIRQKGGA